MKKFLKAFSPICLFLLTLAVSAQAQAPELVKSGITMQSTPVDASGTAFFVATAPGFGQELWASGGTTESTRMVRDLNAGSGNTMIKYYNNLGICPLGSQVVFVGDNGTYGYELWKSDGTETGTVLIKNIRPGTGNGIPSNWGKIFSHNGLIYTSGDDGTTGWELWRTDGTEQETTLFKNIRAGSSASNPDQFTLVEEILYFTADDGINGKELWKTDGTPENTVMVKNIQPGSSGDYGPSYLTEMGGILYFAADNSSDFSDMSYNNRELWRSDGTAAGTYMVKEINPATDEPGLNSWTLAPEFTTVNNEKLFFVADDGMHGKELWVSDGTETGTFMVKDIVPNPSNASPYGLRAVGNKLFFGITDGVNGGELWISDGTEQGTHMVKDINPGAAGGYMGNNGSIVVNDVLYFRADDGTTGEELWKSDGTEGGTVRVADLATGSLDSSPAHCALIGNSIYFYAVGSAGSGLWKLAVSGDTTTTTTIPAGCIDEDGDGYGEGDSCDGPDCDDTAPDLHDNCTTCIDLDGDGYGQGELCLGPDCDDDDALVWDDCTPCTVKLLPRRLSRFFSILRPLRFFLFRAPDGMQYAKDTPIAWPDDAVETLFQFPLGKKKRYLLALVRVHAPLLEATDTYEVMVGGCGGVLTIKAL